MVHGENRRRFSRLTVKAGEGIKNFGTSTFEAIVNPTLIPEKVRPV